MTKVKEQNHAAKIAALIEAVIVDCETPSELVRAIFAVMADYANMTGIRVEYHVRD